LEFESGSERLNAAAARYKKQEDRAVWGSGESAALGSPVAKRKQGWFW